MSSRAGAVMASAPRSSGGPDLAAGAGSLEAASAEAAGAVFKPLKFVQC